MFLSAWWTFILASKGMENERVSNSSGFGSLPED